MTTKIKLSSNVSDVDVTTTAPTQGQVLIWDATNEVWVPADQSGSGGGETFSPFLLAGM